MKKLSLFKVRIKSVSSVLSSLLSGVLLACCLQFLQSCTYRKVNAEQTVHDNNEHPVRGVYYWKTIFNLTSYESDFLKNQQIDRLYLRMFDVDYGEDWDGTSKCVPVATLQFKSAVPQGVEIVPVVYITQSAISNGDDFSALLYRRIRAMVQGNGLGPVREIQLDCDWTVKTRQPFFKFCRDMVKLAHADSIAVSATIRLHQLTQEAPPVDRGVLMLYNTGSLYDYDTENSILDLEDVKPYLSPGAVYSLPLSLAFPTYSWGLLYRDGEFVSILHLNKIPDTSFYERLGEGRYKVTRNHFLGDKRLLEGDEIRIETSEYAEIMKVKNLLLHNLQNPFREHIIYHLDSLNLSQYNESEINDILK